MFELCLNFPFYWCIWFLLPDFRPGLFCWKISSTISLGTSSVKCSCLEGMQQLLPLCFSLLVVWSAVHASPWAVLGFQLKCSRAEFQPLGSHRRVVCLTWRDLRKECQVQLASGLPPTLCLSWVRSQTLRSHHIEACGLLAASFCFLAVQHFVLVERVSQASLSVTMSYFNRWTRLFCFHFEKYGWISCLAGFSFVWTWMGYPPFYVPSESFESDYQCSWLCFW